MPYSVGDAFTPRPRLLDSPALADKMLARGVSREEIEAVLADNEIIESYEQEGRERYVLLAQPRGRPLHVVVAEDDVIDATVVLSVYQPDEEHGWDAETGFRMRKEDRP